MEQLWAPWRMQYIEGVDEGEGCFLCDAAAANCDREKLVLWSSERCVTVMNRFPYNNGHLLVAPTQHVGDFSDMSAEQLQAQMQMLQRCERNLRQVMAPDGFNIGLNIGRPAGAGVEDHLHWHIVPRWNGDTNFMAVTGATKVIPQALEDLWDRLREADAAE
jgi:ATP adenylyltransferase